MTTSSSAYSKRQFNVQLPIELITQIKHASIDESMTLSEFVEELLRAALKERTAPTDESAAAA
ncbi:CopG family transcriptional regulator [Dermabacter hominis 1368]|uniref:CopG family transcriptional regulator n=1 Tax=Dermabacter hominis 1368 TaxID=1450519 RepID=A0ABR4SI62_9MICO|nr:CopG family transcriptional regulator [Dermabacter hominis 1368]